MTYTRSPHLAAWKYVMAGVRDVVGSESSIFQAAVQAAFGRDPDGAKFIELVERLPVSAQDRLWNSVKKHRAKAGRVA